MPARHDDAPYHGHHGLYIAGLVVAAVLFGTSAWLSQMGTLTGWEPAWFASFNTLPDSWRTIGIIITTFGSMWAAAGSVVLAFVLRAYRLAWRLAVSIIGAYGITYFAKEFIDRGRPEALLSDVHIRIAETGMGFPSGHATAITVIMLSVLPYMPWRWRWLVPLAIVLVAASRMYLGVHVPLDVIGGIALGTGVVCFVRILPQPLRVLLRID